MNWIDLSQKFMQGFKAGDLTQKSMGLSESESVTLRAMMRKDGFDGSMAFFICAKVYEKRQGCFAGHKNFAKNVRNLNFAQLNDDELIRELAKLESVHGGFELADFAMNESVKFCCLMYEIQIGRVNLPNLLELLSSD